MRLQVGPVPRQGDADTLGKGSHVPAMTGASGEATLPAPGPRGPRLAVRSCVCVQGQPVVVSSGGPSSLTPAPSVSLKKRNVLSCLRAP